MAKDLTKTDIKEIVKDEIDKYYNKVFISNLVKELKNQNSPVKKEIISMIRDAMVSVHKFMWFRRDTWQSDIK